MAKFKSRRDAVFGLLDRAVPSDYVPAAFFLHFGAGFQSGSAAIEKHREFFTYTGMDIVKIQLELPFPHFSPAGPDDWASAPVLEDEFFDPQIAVVRGLVEALKEQAPVVLTLYSPFMVACHFADSATLHRHFEQAPEKVRKGMEIVTDSMMKFVRRAAGAGLDGFYHSTQGAESRRFSDPAVFNDSIKPFDLAVMGLASELCPMNILHICDYHKAEFGEYSSLDPFLDYPGQIVNCSLSVGGGTTSPSKISKLFDRPFMGGMDRSGPLATGGVEGARTVAREALKDRPDRFMLAADCTVPGATPWENLRGAIEEAHAV